MSANKSVFLWAKARTKTVLSIYVVWVRVIIYVGLMDEPLKFCDHFKGRRVSNSIFLRMSKNA